MGHDQDSGETHQLDPAVDLEILPGRKLRLVGHGSEGPGAFTN